jgi:pimeloyl-ACP methyl ester carboxylesterase
MLKTVMVRVHSIVAILLVLAARAAGAGPAGTQVPAPVGSLQVFMQGRLLGTEQATVTATADGWIVRGTGRLGVPVDLSTTRFEMRYDRDWRPISLEVDGALRGRPLIMRTTFAGGSATTDITQAGQQTRKVDAVSADPVVLPNMFFCSYEALALRLRGVAVPGSLKAYIAGQAEIPLRVTARGSERIQTAGGAVSATRYEVTLENPGGPVQTEVWVDQDGRLLRFRVPAQGLEVAREDIAAVSSRVETLGRPNDEQVRVPAAGFTLAATLSKPESAPRPPRPGKAPAYTLPAIVLVAGSGAVDRDETVSGIPVFAQLANLLADAGFIVVRYDKRGVGQSGGRAESATIRDYADDARAVVEFLRKRKDVDKDRVAIVGHSEGGLVALQAAAGAGTKRVKAAALMATPGTIGGELVLEQQRYLLDKLKLPDEEKQSRITLQRKIQAAVVSGTGWDGVPEGYRKQADTPWFRTFLMFDPLKAVNKVEQPLLVLQAERDTQVPAPRHGQLLFDAAKGRKKHRDAALVIVDGANHLFVPAETGDVDEYALLQDKRLSQGLAGALVPWLKDKLHVGATGAGR